MRTINTLAYLVSVNGGLTALILNIERYIMEPKQVIVVRKDLNMRKGKLAAQVAHASMGVLLGMGNIVENGCFFHMSDIPEAMMQWLTGAFVKIVVGVDSEEELLDIYTKAMESGVPHSIIQDAGRTEFNGVPTITCIGVGPDYPDKIDTLTGHLKLL